MINYANDYLHENDNASTVINREAKNKVFVKSDSEVEVHKGTQFRDGNHTHTKHHVSANGDVASHFNHKRKKGNTCAAKFKRSACSLISMAGNHGECCDLEVFETSSKAGDRSNVVSDLVDQLALNSMSMVPNFF